MNAFISRAKELVCFFLFSISFFLSLSAHEVQPAYLELRQTSADTYNVLWKLPARDDLKQGIVPVFPEGTKITSEPLLVKTPGAYVERFTLSAPGGLAGRPFAVSGAAAAVADVLVRIILPDGSTEIVRLTPAMESVMIPAQQSNWQKAGSFIRQGIDHILMGVDHLLFVLGLLLIVRDRWMLVKTITAFTIAHSITLAIATLGYASAPTLPLNAAIALSILFLGPEIVRVQRGETSLTIRHPWVVAFAFGLLHGFGFASGLTALGLSHQEIPLALLCFNVGVEIGQLFFVIVILLLEQSFRVLEIRWTRWAAALPTYTVGGLGAYWTIQRIWIMFAGVS
jgi:hypothetical protein